MRCKLVRACFFASMHVSSSCACVLTKWWHQHVRLLKLKKLQQTHLKITKCDLWNIRTPLSFQFCTMMCLDIWLLCTILYQLFLCMLICNQNKVLTKPNHIGLTSVCVKPDQILGFISHVSGFLKAEILELNPSNWGRVWLVETDVGNIY